MNLRGSVVTLVNQMRDGDDMQTETKDQLVLPQTVADYLGTTTGNLAQMRYRGTGPKFVKLGHRAIRYRWSDVEAWVEANTLTQSDQDYSPKSAA